MNVRTIVGLSAGAAALGAVGFVAWRALSDEFGDADHAVDERTAGAAEVGYDAAKLEDAIMAAHDRYVPKDLIGGKEYEAVAAGVVVQNRDGSYGPYVTDANAPFLRATDANKDDVVSRAELHDRLQSMADDDGVIRGIENARALEDVITTLKHPMVFLGSSLDATEATALLRTGTKITATIDGVEHEARSDQEGRDYDLFVRDAIHHARTGSAWKELASHDSAQAAIAQLGELGATTFKRGAMGDS